MVESAPGPAEVVEKPELKTSFDALRTGWPGAVERKNAVSLLENAEIASAMKNAMLELTPLGTACLPAPDDTVDIVAQKPKYRSVGFEKGLATGCRFMMKSTITLMAVLLRPLLECYTSLPGSPANPSLRDVQKFMEDAP